jgi:thiamine biosynthesis lipoprotein
LPPVGLPPVGLPPVGLPPVGLPPVGLPPVGLPPVGLESLFINSRFPTTPMNRRDFLHPRRLARSAAGILDTVGALPSFDEQPETQPEATLLRFSRQAMATTFEVLTPFDAPSALQAAEEAFAEIDLLEDQLTVYRDSSEMSRINRTASQVPVPVERSLFDLFKLAAEIHQATEGAFDITTGALTRAWGFYRRCGRVPSDSERADVLKRVGMNSVLLDDERRTIRYQKPGLEINLGSIGKGYALDCAANLIKLNWNLDNVLLHGGQSSILARGSEPGQRLGWKVGLRHPVHLEQRIAILRLHNRAIGTSSATFQNLEHEGRKLGHILDPRTGWPAEGLASATAVAGTAAIADALATAFFILGVEKTAAFCTAHPHIGAILLPQEEDAQPVVFNLSAEEIQLCPGFGRSERKQ